MSAWKLVTNFAIPPSLVLTVLLIIPLPQVVKRGLLVFTQKVLHFKVAGGLRLAHVMIVLTAAALTACSISTYRLSTAVLDDTITPNQRIGLLAKKWREERNFWIALLSFLLWANLYRLYTLLLDHDAMHARVRDLEKQVSQLKVLMGRSGGVPASAHAEPSAPPEPTGKQAKQAAAKAPAAQQTQPKKEM